MSAIAILRGAAVVELIFHSPEVLDRTCIMASCVADGGTTGDLRDHAVDPVVDSLQVAVRRESFIRNRRRGIRVSWPPPLRRVLLQMRK